MTEQPIAVLMFVTSTYMCGLSLCLPVHTGCIVDWRLCVSQCIYPSIYCTVCIHLDYSTISIRLSYFYRNIYILYFYSPGSIYSSYHIYIYMYIGIFWPVEIRKVAKVLLLPKGTFWIIIGRPGTDLLNNSRKTKVLAITAPWSLWVQKLEPDRFQMVAHKSHSHIGNLLQAVHECVHFLQLLLHNTLALPTLDLLPGSGRESHPQSMLHEKLQHCAGFLFRGILATLTLGKLCCKVVYAQKCLTASLQVLRRENQGVRQSHLRQNPLYQLILATALHRFAEQTELLLRIRSNLAHLIDGDISGAWC